MAEDKHGTSNARTAWIALFGLLLTNGVNYYTSQARYDALKDKCDIVEAERKDIKGREDKWKFSAPLYRLIPGDIDFLARQLRVDKKAGAQMLVIGPNEGDRYAIIITSLLPQGKDSAGNQQYAVRFTVEGMIGTNAILGSMSDPVLMSPDALAGPLNALVHEFYIFVDRVDIDYVYLTIARRRIVEASGGTVRGNRAPFGMQIFERNESRPEPILIASP